MCCYGAFCCYSPSSQLCGNYARKIACEFFQSCTDKIHLLQPLSHSDVCPVSIRKLFRTTLRESIVIPAVEGIVGWLVYNSLISLYGFSWVHAALFGLIGYIVQAILFEPLRRSVARVSKTQ
jgi:hypothetical protein